MADDRENSMDRFDNTRFGEHPYTYTNRTFTYTHAWCKKDKPFKKLMPTLTALFFHPFSLSTEFFLILSLPFSFFFFCPTYTNTSFSTPHLFFCESLTTTNTTIHLQLPFIITHRYIIHLLELPMSSSASSAPRKSGHVKFFNSTKGYGFIIPAEESGSPVVEGEKKRE